MSDKDESQTEEPTEKRLEEARRRGQFAKAPELGMAIGLLTAGMILRSQGSKQAMAVAEFSTHLFGHLDPKLVTPENILRWVPVAVVWLSGLCLPVLGGVALAGILSGGAQSKFAISTEVFDDPISKINPLSGAQRIFSVQGLLKAALDGAKLVIAALLLYNGIKAAFSDPVFYTPVSLDRLAGILQGRSLDLLMSLAGAIAVLGGLNYVYQWRKTQKDLGMSKHEVKEEMKEANGDPHVKAARRQMARRLLQKQMLASVPTADVVVTNPTHFAVALKYERNKDDAPMVLAKGKGAFAQRLKAIAAQHGVPTVENRPVAQALFKHGQVGAAIPGPLFRAVAEILGFVYRTHRYYFHELKGRRAAADKARK